MNTRERINKRITDKIVEKLRDNTIPWRAPWKTGYSMVPTSGSTGKAYRGINHLMLSSAGYENRYWFTFNQISKLGGKVVPGEKSSPVVFWKFYEKKSATEVDDDGNPTITSRWGIPFSFNVFNVEQTEGLPEKWTEKPEVAVDDDWNPVENADAIVDGYENPPAIFHDIHERAYYTPSKDEVHVPKMGEFSVPEKYYGTLFHELGHSTGHEKRLGRAGMRGGAAFGSVTYSKEELVAEMTAAMLCGHAGLPEAELDNTVAYIDGWKSKLGENTGWVVWAAGQAQKAVDLILGA